MPATIRDYSIISCQCWKDGLPNTQVAHRAMDQHNSLALTAIGIGERPPACVDIFQRSSLSRKQLGPAKDGTRRCLNEICFIVQLKDVSRNVSASLRLIASRFPRACSTLCTERNFPDNSSAAPLASKRMKLVANREAPVTIAVVPASSPRVDSLISSSPYFLECAWIAARQMLVSRTILR